ncbi:hypothetical protein [Streptomyces sp. ODS28]|uniref:hypothetical protein n=1 Tax=Streptomyces sp. ODS28 TaxID=3136688 RepID=UPI0031E9D39C
MSKKGQVVRRLLLSVDARGYGAADAALQAEIQEGLVQVLDAAALEAGLARPAWERQTGGDGELAVLPPEEPEARVVERFPRELRDALFRYNRHRAQSAKLRLRLAVHFGEATPGVMGRSGQGPVTVSRLCDSEPLKQALELSGADLVVIYSQQIFADTLSQGHTHLDLADLRRVPVTVKTYTGDGWIWIPGHAVPDEVGAEAPSPPRGEPVPARESSPKGPHSGSPSPGELSPDSPLAHPTDGTPAAHDVLGVAMVPAAGPRSRGGGRHRRDAAG